jgi:hypothetical protein
MREVKNSRSQEWSDAKLGARLLVILGFLISRLLDFLFPCVGQEQKLKLSLTSRIFPNTYQSDPYPISTRGRQ